MAKISSLGVGDGQLTLWLVADTAEDRRLLTRIINALADEINAHIAAYKWDFEGIAEAGADIIKFRDDALAKAKEAKDETV